MKQENIKKYVANEKTLLKDAMCMIDANVAGILFVINNTKELVGAISDGDIRRWIIANHSLEVQIREVMNPNPIFLTCRDNNEAKKLMRQKCISYIPVLDGNHHIIDIYVADDKAEIHQFEQLSEASTIIMAGGKGTRLYPYTKILPKPLIPIGEVPILERIIREYIKYGIVDYYLTVNYKKNMIKSYFAETDLPVAINYVDEDTPLGTAGSIRLIERKFNNPIFVANCDVLIRTDYSEIYRYHQKSQNAITIVASLRNEVIPYGVINSGENGEVISMEEKPTHSYLINTGMYIINPDIIEKIPSNTFFHMTDLVNCSLNDGLKVGMYPISEDAFLDMGEFEEMKRMEKKLHIED